MNRWIIQSGTVLVTCSGTIGRVAITSNAIIACMEAVIAPEEVAKCP